LGIISNPEKERRANKGGRRPTEQRGRCNAIGLSAKKEGRRGKSLLKYRSCRVSSSADKGR
jgi:hypothetical protein